MFDLTPIHLPHHTIFSSEPDGESVELSLEKGDSYTFIRTDDGHALVLVMLGELQIQKYSIQATVPAGLLVV